MMLLFRRRFRHHWSQVNKFTKPLRPAFEKIEKSLIPFCLAPLNENPDVYIKIFCTYLRRFV